MASRIVSLPIDCADPELLAAFWAQVLGWPITKRGGYGVTIGPSAGPFEIDFRVVPDAGKVVKNRLHLDINPTDRDQEAELTRLRALGAVPVDVGQGDVSWHVLADPEGNEFCLCRARVDP
ncbi:VOC family protein [Lentzea tibetensis]|uniref:VOC family protein n=1 Tax=Lentzea tibetensis TaxID=2591470 RepID=A0A563EIG5_9PSEU|nr:VOC family protein [Lentzea tibetensis]TWP46484.1 VOC family protein [Lentzea tibetensis]